MYVLEWSLKFFLGCYYLSYELASFLRIISKSRNKRGCHTTLQQDFTIPNVRRWPFFDFDTPLYCHFVLTTKVEKLAVFGGIFEFQMAVENFLGVVTPYFPFASFFPQKKCEFKNFEASYTI